MKSYIRNELNIWANNNNNIQNENSYCDQPTSILKLKFGESCVESVV